MTEIHLYKNKDCVENYTKTLDFDPLFWVNNNPSSITFDEFFKMSKEIDDEEQTSGKDRSIRYMDDDVCFEIIFRYISKEDIANRMSSDYYTDMNIYLHENDGVDEFYILEDYFDE